MKRILLITIAFLMISNVSANLDGYNCSKKIILTGNASGAQTDYQILLNISYEENMSSNFNDLRFTRANGITLIDAWLESKVDNSYALVWVEFPTTPANAVEQIYWMYYGKADAVDYWDIGTTFVIGDDFSADMSKWSTVRGTWAIEGGILKQTNTVGSGVTYAYVTVPNGDYIIEVKIRPDTFTDTDYSLGIVARTNGVDTVGSQYGHGFSIPYNNINEVASVDFNSGWWANRISPGFTFTTGNWYNYKVYIPFLSSNTNIKGKAWLVGTSEPQIYQVDATLTSYSNLTCGVLGGTGGSNVRSLISYDNFHIYKYVSNPPTYEFDAEVCEEEEEEEEDISGLTTINFYYPHNNTTTDIKYISNDRYNVTTSNYLSAENLSVVIIKDQIVSEDIITNPEKLMNIKYFTLFVFLTLFIVSIIALIKIIKRGA